MVKRNERTTTIKIGIVFVKPAKGHNNNEDDDNKQTCLCTESVAHSRTEITAYNSYKYVVAFRTHSNSPSDRSPFNRAAPYQCAVSVRIWMCFLLLLLSLPLLLAVFSFLLILTVANFAVMLFSSLRFACCCNSIS